MVSTWFIIIMINKKSKLVKCHWWEWAQLTITNAFAHCTATASLWSRYAVECGSPDSSCKHLPSSQRKTLVKGPIAPNASVTGLKRYCRLEQGGSTSLLSSPLTKQLLAKIFLAYTFNNSPYYSCSIYSPLKLLLVPSLEKEIFITTARISGVDTPYFD